MMKLKKLFLFVPLMSLMLLPVAQASGNTSDASGTAMGSKKVIIDPTLFIKKFDDGRVAPVPNASSLSLGQLNKILHEMAVSDEELEKFPLDFKKTLVSRGGVEVPIETTTKQYYNSLDGKKYLITPENEDEINIIKEIDKATLLTKHKGIVQNSIRAKQKGIVTTLSMGSKSDGIWSASSSLFYVGLSSSGTEFIYDYYSSYNWSDYPNFFLTDSIAESWDYGISSASSNGANNWQQIPNDPYHQDLMTITRSIGGTKGDLDLQYAYKQYGALHDQLRIPLSYRGTTKQLTASYVHPWLGGIVGVVLSYFSIDWNSFTGDEWHWDSTFTVHT